MKKKPKRRISNAHHKRLKPQTTKWKKSGVPTNHREGGPVRSRKGRGRNDSPYIEERTRSNNRNARRGGDQQRQERKGACSAFPRRVENECGRDCTMFGVASCVVRGNRSLYLLFCLAVEGNNEMVYDCLFERLVPDYGSPSAGAAKEHSSQALRFLERLNSKTSYEGICFNRMGVNKFE
ncbi:hypothetical protein TNCV_484541 [Trichonephila clavipes]|nr:hypothetical protein TNCV_484541 [Trichonephila clavipes]